MASLDPINNITIPDQTTKGNHMASLASNIVTYLTNNDYYLDKCSKVVEIMKRKSNSLTKKMKKVYSKEPIKKSRANI